MLDLGVHIKVKDFRRSFNFYKRLGFKTVFEYGPDKKIKEDYSGAVFKLGGSTLEIADGHRAVKDRVFNEDILSSKISLMVKVGSLSSILESVKTQNIPLAVEPRHYYWGTLEFVIKDPDGMVIVFVCPYSESEAKKVNADEKWADKNLLQ